MCTEDVFCDSIKRRMEDRLSRGGFIRRRKVHKRKKRKHLEKSELGFDRPCPDRLCDRQIYRDLF